MSSSACRPSISRLVRLERKFSILEITFEDLQRAEYAAEFLEAKDAIEKITDTAPVEPVPNFPALTDEQNRPLSEVLGC